MLGVGGGGGGGGGEGGESECPARGVGVGRGEGGGREEGEGLRGKGTSVLSYGCCAPSGCMQWPAVRIAVVFCFVLFFPGKCCLVTVKFCTYYGRVRGNCCQVLIWVICMQLLSLLWFFPPSIFFFFPRYNSFFFFLAGSFFFLSFLKLFTLRLAGRFLVCAPVCQGGVCRIGEGGPRGCREEGCMGVSEQAVLKI